jgi:hypothetical protein
MKEYNRDFSTKTEVRPVDSAVENDKKNSDWFYTSRCLCAS